MVELYKLPGSLTDLVSGIQWAETNAKGGDVVVYANQIVGAGSTLMSTAISTAAYHSGYVTITNSGASTNFSVLIQGSINTEGDEKTNMISCVLNATTKTSVGNPVAALPNYIFVTAINLDSSNAASLSITISL